MNKQNIKEWRRTGDYHSLFINGFRKASITGRGFKSWKCSLCEDFYPYCPDESNKPDRTNEYFLLYMPGNTPKKFNTLSLAKEYAEDQWTIMN